MYMYMYPVALRVLIHPIDLYIYLCMYLSIYLSMHPSPSPVEVNFWGLSIACQSELLAQRLNQAHAPTYVVTPYLSSSPVITHRQRSCIICIAMHSNEKGIRLCRQREQRNEGKKTRLTKFADCIDCLKPEDLFQLHVPVRYVAVQYGLCVWLTMPYKQFEQYRSLQGSPAVCRFR